MKKQFPLLLGFLAGGFAIAEYFIPAHGVHVVQSYLLEVAQVLAAAAFVLGGINVIQVNVPAIRRRREDWQYKLILIGSAFVMLCAGIAWHDFGDAPEGGTVAIQPSTPLPPSAPRPTNAALTVVGGVDDADIQVDGQAVASPGGQVSALVKPGEHTITVQSARAGYTHYETKVTLYAGEGATVTARLRMKWGTEGRVFAWLYDHVFAPCNATMFALLAFFIASAAFRAFRARNVDAALLLGSAILTMLGRVPIGRAIASWLPDLGQWIIDIPNNAGRRAILIGAALGAIATSLRVILGLERSHLGND